MFNLRALLFLFFQQQINSYPSCPANVTFFSLSFFFAHIFPYWEHFGAGSGVSEPHLLTFVSRS